MWSVVLLSLSILTCQYPDFRSSEENHWEPCQLLRVSCQCRVGVGILDVLIVQFPEVNAEPQAPILPSDQDHCASPWTVRFPDMALMSSISWGWAFTSSYMWGYSLVALFEGHLISQLNLVLDEGCFPKVQVAVGKLVFPFDQQLPGLILFLLGPLL